MMMLHATLLIIFLTSVNAQDAQDFVLGPIWTGINGPNNPSLSCLKVKGELVDGAPVVISDCVGPQLETAQVWTWPMTVSGSGAGPSHQDFTGVIKAGTSNFCLDNNGAVNKENKLQVWTCNGLPWQEWIFHSFDRTIQLSSQGDLTYPLCVDLTDSSTVDGTQAQTAECNGNQNQNWDYKNPSR